MSRSAQRGAVLAVAVLTLVVLSAWVLRLSSAAFTAQANSDVNTWETGHVDLTTSMTGGAEFSATGMVPGQVVERCVLVTYAGETGTADVDVRMYGDSSVTDTNSLGADLVVTVSSVAGDHTAGGGACAASYDSQSIQAYAATPRTLASFASSHASWGAGLEPAWITNSDGTRTYRIRVQLSETSDKTSSSASYVFRWEVRTINPSL